MDLAKLKWTSMAGVLIRGQGVAASICAQLLGAAGLQVAVEETGRARLPAILLGGTTQTLIRDILGEGDWLRGLPRISKRVVAWGPDAKTVTVPHFAVVISEEALAERLRPKLAERDGAAAEWTFFASRPLPAASVEHHFGTRRATARAVELKDGADASACWIESLANGWMFLIPGWLLAVGSPPDVLLGESRLIAEQIRRCGRAGAEFPAYPRIADPLCGPGWLCGGTAALAFDPLCGDGAGHAIREAILASAVIRAAAQGAHADELLAHYRARLVAGFRRHLEVCRHFYSAGGSGNWWRTELELIEQGIAWCGAEPRFRFQLNGFELRAVG